MTIPSHVRDAARIARSEIDGDGDEVQEYLFQLLCHVEAAVIDDDNGPPSSRTSRCPFCFREHCINPLHTGPSS